MSKEAKVASEKQRQTPESLGFVVVQVRDWKGRRRFERRSVEWWNQIRQAMGLR